MTEIHLDPQRVVRDLSAQPCGLGLGFNGDMAHENHTRARHFFVEHPETTAAQFREAGIKVVRQYFMVPFWQGDRANRMRFYHRWKAYDWGRAVLDMSKPWHWVEPKVVYDFYKRNGMKVLVCLSSEVYDEKRDCMSGEVGLVMKKTLEYLDWLKTQGYADCIIGFELDNEPYLNEPDPVVYGKRWGRIIPEIVRAWPGAKIGLPVAIYLRDDPDLAEVKKRLTAVKALAGPRSEERINQWTGNAIAALGESARQLSHLCIHVYGAGFDWNCNCGGIRRTDKLRAAFPQVAKTKTWITEWRDQSDNDRLSQRRFRTLLWKANYILMSLAQPEVDAIFQHSLYGQAGAIYWSTGEEWYFQPEHYGTRRNLRDITGDGRPRMVTGGCGALYRLLFDACSGRTKLLGFGASRGPDAGAHYYASIVRHDRSLAKNPESTPVPYDGDCMWWVVADADRKEGTLIAVNTRDDSERVMLVLDGLKVGPAFCRTLRCPPARLDTLEAPGETPPWRVDGWSDGPYASGTRTFEVPRNAVFTARFQLEKDVR